MQVRYRTIDQSAFAGKDFVGTKDGILSFKSGETTKDILIPIIDDMSATGTDEYFEVTLLMMLDLIVKLRVISDIHHLKTSNHEFYELDIGGHKTCSV